MKIENIKKYVYYYSDNFPSIGIIRQMIYVYVLFAVLTSIFGFVGKGPMLIVAITIDVITLLYIGFAIALPKIWKSSEFSHRFIVSGICSIFITMYFETFAFLFVFMEQDSRWIAGYTCFLLIGLLISVLLFWSFSIRKIQLGKFNKDKKRHRKLGVYSGIGATSGIVLGRILVPMLGGKVTITFMVLLMFLIVCFGSYGTTNFLKCYYIKKYSIPGDGLESIIESQLHPSKKKKHTRKM